MRLASGATPPGDAHRLVELERDAGAEPPAGCVWLEDGTIEDIELAEVVHGIDRTVSPVGAQQLWRMVAAPAQHLDVLAERERAISCLADRAERDKLRKTLARAAEPDMAYVPLLLWSETPEPVIPGWASRVLAVSVLVCIALAAWWPVVLVPAMLVVVGNVIVDDRGNTRHAKYARALQMFGRVLSVAEQVVAEGRGPAELRAQIAAELPALRPIGRRLAMLSVRDPFDISGLVIAAFQLRVIAMSACLELLEREREGMRRLHRLVGELDALQAIAAWRDERADLTTPELHAGPAELAVTDLKHPGIELAVGNGIALGTHSLIVTGSNASGKSTFLRTLAINAILAQSIHTVCGGWRASLMTVHAAMRAIDGTAAGLSTYAAEVAAIAKLVAAAAPGSPPALFVLDEPFRGTNPSVRVPIVVAVLEYLARGHVVVAATHDLDVAKRLPERFERGYFREAPDDEPYDFTLRPGTAVTTNAVTLLERAGYPAAILDAVRSASAVSPS